MVKQLAPGVKVVDNSLYVAPRTYTSMQGVLDGEDDYKQVIAVYDEKDGRLLAVKTIDDTVTIDKNGKYYQAISLDKIADSAIIKTFLFEDDKKIKSVADYGMVVYR